MQKILALALLLSSLLLGTESAEQLYLKNACNSCHGMYGEGIGASPRLQGKSETLLLQRLKELQEGKTKSAFGTVMVSFAKALNKTQTEAMAKYLSTLKTTVNEERYDIEFDTAGDGGS